MNWISFKKNADGILQPVVNGKRCLYHISSKTLIQLEEEDEIEPIIVGKYRFRKKAFEWTNKKLIESINKNYDWIVVDEIGLLELRGEGLDKSIKILLQKASTVNIVFVIRKSLLNNALDYYKIYEYKILEI